MSQVDKLNYIPLLFWFFVLFLVIYFLIFSFVIPLLHSVLKTRLYVFNRLTISAISVNEFFFSFKYLIFSLLKGKYLNILKQISNLILISYSSVTYFE